MKNVMLKVPNVWQWPRTIVYFLIPKNSFCNTVCACMAMQIKLVVVVIPNSGPKWARLHPFSNQNGAKTLPFGAAHTYIAYVGEYPCPRGDPPVRITVLG